MLTILILHDSDIKRMLLAIILICFAINFPCYSQNVPTSAQSKEIDSLIASTNIGDSIDKLYYFRNKSTLYDHKKGRIQSNAYLSIYHRRKLQIDSAFYYINQSEKVAKEEGLMIQLQSVYMAKAGIYDVTEKYEEELDLLHGIYSFYKKKILDTLTPDSRSIDFLRVTRLNIGGAYTNMGEYELAEKFYMEVIEDPIGDSSSLIYSNTHFNLSENYYKQEKYKEANEWVHKGILLGEKHGHNRITNMMRWSLCRNLLEMKDYENAQKVFEEIDKGLVTLDTNYLSGIIFTNKGDYKNAERAFIASITQRNDKKSYLTSYELLSDLYLKNKEYEKAIQIRDEYNAIRDSINDDRNKSIVKNSQIGFKLIEEELKTKQLSTKNELLSIQNKKQKQFIWAIIVVLILTFLLTYFFFQNLKSRKRVKYLKANEKKILENQIKEKENELSSTLLFFNQKLVELKEIDSKFENAITDEMDPEILKIKKMFASFINSNSDIEIFGERMESQFPGITAQLKIKHPNLTVNDIRHCLLIKLRMSIKESAVLMNVSSSAVKVARNRIKKKIEIPDGILLSDYLNQISNQIPEQNLNT